LGKTYLHMWSNLLGVPLEIFLGMVLMPMSISHWIQMLGQNQGMWKSFIVLALSSYSFCKETSGSWDKLLTNIPPPGYG
jgi:hypothetical protein